MENMFRFEFRILFQLVTEKRPRTHRGSDSHTYENDKNMILRSLPGPGQDEFSIF